MTFVGNNGVEIRKEVRNAKIYYVCSDGVEFLFLSDGKVNFIGNDGTELKYNNSRDKLISNNGNDAVIKEKNGIISIEFLDGTVFSGIDAQHNYGKS